MQGPESTGDVDPVVVNAVQVVRDRFGAIGLRSLISLATRELARVEQAETDLAAIDNGDPAVQPVNDSPDAADTQAWLAYTEYDRD
ncbi:hypothetical protein [Phytoactinopolyspora halotolerans]|uniref:Uncharacterized protein n=1 Tax=Phytoactinopolyspora halotolerans TaxID=1981512 RepID=A0A6L9S2S9_9ACTN|nr:hypothetical protein [Phytoactinopolyspora halotolerans]NED98923.1 hypothetical protein [Phytoactinopolyspora halotolerans]